MRVLLIQPPLNKSNELIYAPIALLSVGTEISSMGNDVSIFDLNLISRLQNESFNSDLLNILDVSIKDYQPHVIGLTAYCSNFPFVV